MIPDPIIGKHYRLKHKSFAPAFRGYVRIANTGYIDGKLIFRTCQNGDRWYWWNDYNYEYIGDLA